MWLLRHNVATVFDQYDYRFELGMAAERRTGREVVLISTGLTTMRAGAAEFLAAGALPTLHDRDGLFANAVVAKARPRIRPKPVTPIGVRPARPGTGPPM